jgi:gliding motility-associated-like protein
LFSGFSVSAQFSVSGSQSYSLPNPVGVDFVFIINGINNMTEITYNAPHTTINWFRFSNPTASISNLNHIFPETGGYIARIDGNDRFIWVIDYQQHLPELLYFEPIHEESDCDYTVLQLNPNAVPPMVYYAFGNPVPRHINREFTVRYYSLEYNDGWNRMERTRTITFPTSQQMRVPTSLYSNVRFTLSGDQFADMFNINPKPSVRSINPAVTAIESRLTALVTVRDALNEVSRPSEREPTPPIIGSAPIDILFESRPSDDDAMVEWRIYRDGATTPLVTRTDRNHRYTFSTRGRYDVKLSVTNGDCVHRDSVVVEVRESMLAIPNVFTPDGDGINDEFCVVFRSLESFHGWIYNSWGHLVFEWTDPARGWDGRVRGRNAPSGTYFYVIRARGTDGVAYNLRGDVSIIR